MGATGSHLSPMCFKILQVCIGHKHLQYQSGGFLMSLFSLSTKHNMSFIKMSDYYWLMLFISEGAAAAH